MNLFDIIEKEKWHKMQEGFKKALDISIQTVDLEGRPLPGINEPYPFCMDMVKMMGKRGRKEYEECAPRLIKKIKSSRNENHTDCLFGLHLYGIPIEIKEEGTVAYVVVGPVLHKQPDVSECRKAAKARGISTEELIDSFRSLKRFSFTTIESTLELLREVEHALLHRAVYTTTTSHALADALHRCHGGHSPHVITNSFPLQPAPGPAFSHRRTAQRAAAAR